MGRSVGTFEDLYLTQRGARSSNKWWPAKQFARSGSAVTGPARRPPTVSSPVPTDAEILTLGQGCPLGLGSWGPRR